MLSPTLNGVHQIFQKQQNLPPVRRGSIMEKPFEIGQECIVSRAVQLPSFHGEIHLQAPPVFRMGYSQDEPFSFKLIDHASHGAELDMELSRKFTHRLRTAEVKTAQTVGLGNSQCAVGRLIMASKLIKRCETIERLVEAKEIAVVSHCQNTTMIELFESRTIFNGSEHPVQ
jgi:hypothetical protein